MKLSSPQIRLLKCENYWKEISFECNLNLLLLQIILLSLSRFLIRFVAFGGKLFQLLCERHVKVEAQRNSIQIQLISEQSLALWTSLKISSLLSVPIKRLCNYCCCFWHCISQHKMQNNQLLRPAKSKLNFVFNTQFAKAERRKKSL